MIQIINEKIVQTELPQTGILKDGTSVSNYDLLPMEVLIGEGWVESPQPIIELSVLQQNKIYELNYACNQTIQNGFNSSALGVSHHYRFNKDEDQPNFTQQILLLMLNPTITTLTWKTEDAGYLVHTKAQFMGVVNDIAIGKTMCIDRYWDLKLDVLNATIAEEIQSINW